MDLDLDVDSLQLMRGEELQLFIDVTRNGRSPAGNSCEATCGASCAITG